MTKTALVAVCTVLAFFDSTAGAEEIPGPTDRAQALVETLRAEWEAPGLSAAVSVEGEVVFTGGAGRADADGAPVDSRTRFRIASVSKPVTAVLVLRLVDEGLLGLDERVLRHLPALPVHVGEITVRQLLAHTSGIRHYEPGETSHRTEHFDAPLDALAPVLEEPLLFAPGSESRYTTYGYTLLQAVVEAVTGAGFQEALDTYLFEPVGMGRTSLDRAGEEASRATGFDRGGPVAFDDVSFKYAGGGMVSTPTDLVRFCGALTRDDFLEPETRERLLRPAFPELDDNQSYGFAVERELTSGLLRIWHPGRGNGFEGYLLCYPEEKVAVAVLTNQDWTDPWNEVGRAAETLARLYLPAIHLYRTPPQVLVRRLEEMVTNGEIDKAVETYADYRQEIEDRWGAGLEVHRLAEGLTTSGNLEGALALFEANAEAFPDSWQSQFALAEARLRVGDLDGATRALEAAPSSVPATEEISDLEDRLDELTEPPVPSVGGEYRLVLEETGLAEELGMTIRISKGESGPEATARIDGMGELRVLSMLVGGSRVAVFLESPYGLLDLDLVRTPGEIEGRWKVGSESGRLRGEGARTGTVEKTQAATAEAAG